MDSTTILGLVAGALTTVSFVPQVVKTWKTRSAKDVSVWMFTLLCAGIFFWIIYGFLIRSLPVILTNIVTLVLASIVLALKVRYK